MGVDFGSAFIKMIGALLLILGLIMLLLYLLKRLRLRSLSLENYPEMRLIGMLNLAPKRSLALVELLDQWLLVGIGSENVTLISKFKRPVEMDHIATPETGKGMRFLSLLQEKRLNGWRKKGPGKGSDEGL